MTAEENNHSANPDCPACAEKRLHTEAEWAQFHPLRGHGYTKENGWSHPEAAKRGLK